MVTFSVIVPVYNVAPFLQSCVDSVLEQSYGDLELLLIDDGSTDESGGVCDQYAAADRRVRVVHKKNGGLSSARNAGLREATGEYVIFLDSDDYWDKQDALALIYDEFCHENVDIVLFKSQKFDMCKGEILGNGNSLSSEEIRNLPYSAQMKRCVAEQVFDTCAWNKAFRRSLMKKADLMFTEGIIAEDIDWAARLALAAERLAVLQKPIHIYRKGRPGAITSSLRLKNLLDTNGSIQRCLQYGKEHKLDGDMAEAYYGYVAYRYVIWLAEYSTVQDSGKKALMEQMKQYKWLLRYTLNRKVAYARAASAVLGLQGATWLLGIYLRHGKR